MPYADSIAWHLDGVTVGMGTGWWPEFSGNYSATVFFDGCSVAAGDTYAGGLGTMAVETVEASRPTIYRTRPMHGRSSGSNQRHSARLQRAWGTRSNHDGWSRRRRNTDLRNWPEGIYIVPPGQSGKVNRSARRLNRQWDQELISFRRRWSSEKVSSHRLCLRRSSWCRGGAFHQTMRLPDRNPPARCWH